MMQTAHDCKIRATAISKQFVSLSRSLWVSQVVLVVVKNLWANAGEKTDVVQSLGWEDPLEEDMATHSRILA